MHHILQPYANLVPFLATALGENVEIALHDLTRPNAPIIAIANNEMSGRVIGDSLTNLGKHILDEKQYESKDYVVNYKSLSASGKLLRSSSYFIRDENNTPVGMLCLNVNISDYDYLNATIRRILGIREEPEVEYQMDHPMEILSGSIETTIQQCISDTLNDMGYPNYMSHSRLNAEEKMTVIRALHDKGIFNIKGAIGCVAKELAASEPTIYRYLKKI